MSKLIWKGEEIRVINDVAFIVTELKEQNKFSKKLAILKLQIKEIFKTLKGK